MSKQFNTQLEMMQDAINYYWNKPERQNYSKKKDSCFYYPIKKNTEGCAIGRCLDKKLAKELDKLESSSVRENKVFESLPDWIKNLDKDFLTILQNFHDQDYFFGDLEFNKKLIKEKLEAIQNHLTFKFEDLTFPNE